MDQLQGTGGLAGNDPQANAEQAPARNPQAATNRKVSDVANGGVTQRSKKQITDRRQWIEDDEASDCDEPSRYSDGPLQPNGIANSASANQLPPTAAAKVPTARPPIGAGTMARGIGNAMVDSLKLRGIALAPAAASGSPSTAPTVRLNPERRRNNQAAFAESKDALAQRFLPRPTTSSDHPAAPAHPASVPSTLSRQAAGPTSPSSSVQPPAPTSATDPSESRRTDDQPLSKRAQKSRRKREAKERAAKERAAQQHAASNDANTSSKGVPTSFSPPPAPSAPTPPLAPPSRQDSSTGAEPDPRGSLTIDFDVLEAAAKQLRETTDRPLPRTPPQKKDQSAKVISRARQPVNLEVFADPSAKPNSPRPVEADHGTPTPNAVPEPAPDTENKVDQQPSDHRVAKIAVGTLTALAALYLLYQAYQVWKGSRIVIEPSPVPPPSVPAPTPTIRGRR